MCNTQKHMLMVSLQPPSVACYRSSSSSLQKKPQHCVTPHQPLLSPSSHPSLHGVHPPSSSLCTPSHLVSIVCASITCTHVIFNTAILIHPSFCLLLSVCFLNACCVKKSRCIYATPRRLRGETPTSVSNVLRLPKDVHSALH